ncbi:MAG: hypothetical protein RR338_03335 [Clostridia bacterium]
MDAKDWNYCPFCGEAIDECECGKCVDLLPQLPDEWTPIDYDDMDTAEAEDGARFDDMLYNHYLER